jgi:pimeloyl-ACP methyl ester carboxylesterase
VPLANLYDVPGFGDLRRVTRRFGVEIKAIGGFVRRIASRLRDYSELPNDPLTLVPFTSDIDLIHSGQTAINADIVAAIRDSVPFGEALRWQIRSAEEDHRFAQALRFNDIIPATLMTLSTSKKRGIADPWNGQKDIHNHAYRFIRNARYRMSPLYHEGRDLELFAALLYIKVLLDDSVAIKQLAKQPGLAAARNAVLDTCGGPDALIALQQRSSEGQYLRARFLYLLKDIRGLAFEANLLLTIRDRFGLAVLQDYLRSDSEFDHLGSSVSNILDATQPLMISAHLHEKDRYRVPDFTGDWQRGGACNDSFGQTLDRNKSELASGQVVVYASPPIDLTSGFSESENPNEFVHVSVPLDSAAIQELQGTSDDDLSIALELIGQKTPESPIHSVLFSPPAVCSVISRIDKEEGVLWIRINAFGLLASTDELTESPIFVALRLYLIKRVEQPPSKFLPLTSSAAASTAIIFVHGIFSDCESCFKTLEASIRSDPRSTRCAIYPFNYDFNNDIAVSGCELADFIQRLPALMPVILICHSMGGLVGRMAVLTGNAPSVKRLIMLGTPNFGVLRTAQTGLLSQLSLHIAGRFYSIFRKRGLQQLTQVNAVFQDPIQRGHMHANTVEYITIPGEFFNESRPFFDKTGQDDRELWSTAFGAIGLASELLNALPLWRIGLAKPHDGIVESASNSLIPSGSGRWSEKSAEINNPGRIRPTYFHIEHKVCDDLTHVSLQHNPDIINLVRDLAFAQNVDQWRQSLTDEEIQPLKIRFAG